MSADLDVNVVQYGEFPVQPSVLAHRVIPAVVGGVFAGLLLVGLGCTPLFKPQSAKAAPEQGTIVQGKAGAYSPKPKSDGSVPDANPSGAVMVSGQTTAAAAPASKQAPSAGVSTIAASSSRRGGLVAGDPSKHRFTINCEPAHGSDPANTPRPESASLQGIMAGSKKAALLDGVLYREGDAFGSGLCPWTIATIDARSVRIEKVFGDRTAGVTIHWQNDKPATASTSAAAPRPRAASMARGAKSR
jgi:hypothetical protein